MHAISKVTNVNGASWGHSEWLQHSERLLNFMEGARFTSALDEQGEITDSMIQNLQRCDFGSQTAFVKTAVAEALFHAGREISAGRLIAPYASKPELLKGQSSLRVRQELQTANY